MTKCESLLHQIKKCTPRGKEWLTLEKEVQEFLRDEATPEEKKKIGQYSEMLYMMCRAIESLNKTCK